MGALSKGEMMVIAQEPGPFEVKEKVSL